MFSKKAEYDKEQAKYGRERQDPHRAEYEKDIK